VPLVTTLADRASKFSKKTAPDRVGARYDGSKEIAIERYGEATSVRFAVQEMVRNILESKGVPPGQHGVYYAFAFMVLSKRWSHTGEAFRKFVAGIKARFTAFGADPAILDLIEDIFVG
jgi:hypothetical protein